MYIDQCLGRILWGVLICLAAGLALAGAAEGTARPTACPAYASVPKGVVLEGRVAGFGSLQNVAYMRAGNCFLVNGRDLYLNPVSAADMAWILRAIQQDGRLGVSIVLSERTIAYGKLTPDHGIARDLYRTDLFLISIVFGWTERLAGIRLPGDYVPQRPARRQHPTVCFATFDGYRVKKRHGTYERAACDMGLTLVPMGKGRAADGGYLPDLDALARNAFEATDQRNRAHVLRNSDAYMRMPVVRRAADLGEAAAFARTLQEAGMDLADLAESMGEPGRKRGTTARAEPSRIRVASAGDVSAGSRTWGSPHQAPAETADELPTDGVPRKRLSFFGRMARAVRHTGRGLGRGLRGIFRRQPDRSAAAVDDDRTALARSDAR